MRKSPLAALPLLLGLSSCVTGSVVERCQAAAAKHGVILGLSDPSQSEMLIDAESLTENWPETAGHAAATCTVRENRLVFLRVGDRELIRR